MIFKDIMREAYEQGRKEERERLTAIIDRLYDEAVINRDETMEEVCERLMDEIDGGGDDEG